MKHCICVLFLYLFFVVDAADLLDDKSEVIIPRQRFVL